MSMTMSIRGLARAAAGAAMGSVLALASCRHATTLSLRDTGAPGDTAPPADSSAGDAATLPAHTDSVTLVIDGWTRTLLVHVPAGATAVARPLVLNLHGSGGTGAQQEAFSAMDAVADREGFIVAYPDAAIVLGGGFAWNVPGQPLSGGGAVPEGAADDVAFFAQAIVALGQRYAIDPRRIFATGMSGGARMASQLGCDLSTTVAAVAPVAGLRCPTPCSGARPVPVISFHGTADTTNPYDGGGEAYWTYSVLSAAQLWAAHDGCDATPVVSQTSAGVSLTSYSGCGGGATVALYTIVGAGHEWPGAPQQTAAIDASRVMWRFFAGVALP
jgi:polyhydroxybutyrate depolymerase